MSNNIGYKGIPGTMVETIDYDNIALSTKGPSTVGKIKFASTGLAFKDSSSGEISAVRVEDMKRMTWLRSARDYQIRVYGKDSISFVFDGFPREAYDELKEFIKINYDIPFELQELSVKGWNWGQLDLQENFVSFVVHGKTAFELPIAQVNNAVVAAKNEVSIEMMQNEWNRKGDSLVEARFFIPGVHEGDDEEQKGAAEMFYNTLKSMAELGAAGGDLVCNLPELPCVTPRGRYEFDLYPSFFRLRGKSYDYKILYSSIVKLFLLPKTDEIHIYFVIGLDPPLRQGQTSHPFLVLQLAKDEDMEVSLEFDQELNVSKFDGKLQKEYEGPTFEVVSAIFRAVSQRRITVPGTFRSQQGFNGVKCSNKANEGFLYPLEKSFIFIPKPTLYMPHSDIISVQFSRVSPGASNSRSFDMKIFMRNGVEHQFSNIAKEEFNYLDSFLNEKKIKVKSELNLDEHAAYAQDEYESESGPEVEAGSQGELESSEDDDFNDAGSGDSDIAEEFDEQYVSEGEEVPDVQEDDNDDEIEPLSSPVKIVEEKPKKPKKPKLDNPDKEPKKKKEGKKEGKKEKKERKGPKRAMTAYLYFVSAFRGKIQSENPGMAFGDVGRLVAQRWKELSDAERQPFVESEKKDKERYNRELEAMKNNEVTVIE